MGAEKISYSEWQRVVAAKTGVPTKVVKEVLDTFFDEVKDAVVLRQASVTVPQFGRFWCREVKGSPARKIGGRVVSIEPQRKVAFSASPKAAVSIS